MKDLDLTAKLLFDQVRAGNYSAAAYALIKIPDNGRRTVVRTLVEKRLLLAEQIKWSRCIARFDSEDCNGYIHPV